MAVEAEELIAMLKEATEKERRGRQAETQAGLSDKKLSDRGNEHENKTAHKLAQTFNTNRTYINEAAKLKELAREKMLAGKIDPRQKIDEGMDNHRNDSRTDAKLAEALILFVIRQKMYGL